MNKLIVGLALTLCCSASPLASEPKVMPEPESATVQASTLRAAANVIYNVGSINLDKAVLPQAIAAISTPEPNANFLIGVGLLGIAYLLQRKTKQS